ncbi:MAG: endonuclease/exonuclease/phosphatase family protein [Planctomycetes bacterium]|nr:endonuclease/exonuclease/phosphatase family protein [Planctomycetota bacterium]
MTLVRVITYNLHKGVRSRGLRAVETILHDAVHAIAERNPDVLLCQEVYHGIDADLQQCHFITGVLGHQHVFGPNAFYRSGCHGNATFARMPVARHHNRDVSESFFERRGILHATLRDGDGEIETLNTHFSLTGRQRRRQWFKLIEALPTDPSRPVLACGDFNDWSGSLDRQARRTGLLHNALWDLPPGERRSFPAHRPLLALDRVYFRGFRLTSVAVLRGDPWRRLSDHLPVEVELELP